MPVGYRLCKARYAPNSPERARKAGDGAARVGGRWNTPGVRAVYTSGSIALAVLEILVHSPLELPDNMELWQVEIPAEFTRLEHLPDSWRNNRYESEVQELGVAQLTQSTAIEVPSAVIPQESNYILNPDHPRYTADTWTLMGTFDFDYRLRPHLRAFVTREGWSQGAGPSSIFV